ncbi:unnamed protein product [Cuscuta campestris]|uniref:Transposase (putative) gypsy type domain-containing protein n=1 Tax=Cuscuta campestris TaxID=132261 RepID=A0A484MWF8_9ASTE|nr:unnamed protein product [Cuscuta campestris]
MSSSDSQDISASDAYASEESLSSSSTGSSSPEPDTRSARKPNIPEPQPVNQMPGQVFAEREDPVSDEPALYDPDKETRDQWVERLEVAGYSPLPTSFVTDIYPHVSKIALNKARRNLPAGYILEYDENWSNIIEPHRDDRIGFHIASLESGTVFPLRPILVELCHCFRILPGQITPNAHRLLNSFANICTHLRIDPSLRLFLYMFEVCPGKPGCEGFVYFKGRNNRKFISDLPQSNRLWKERFVFIKFPPSANPLAGLKWSDNLLKHQFTEPHTTPDLEESLEKLLRGDPYTGQMYHYGGWVWRTQPGGEGTSQAHEAAGHGKETIEVHSEEDTPPTGGASPAGRGPENPTLHKGKWKMRMKKVATTHPAAKRRRGETSPAGESMEELWVKMTLKLKEMGEVGPETLEKLAGDSPSRSFQMEEKLKGVEAHNRELQDLIARQLDELSHLSAIAGEAKAETLQLKEENLKLLEDLELKEREFPGRAKQWVGENLEETARVITSTPEAGEQDHVRPRGGMLLAWCEVTGSELPCRLARGSPSLSRSGLEIFLQHLCNANHYSPSLFWILPADALRSSETRPGDLRGLSESRITLLLLRLVRRLEQRGDRQLVLRNS